MQKMLIITPELSDFWAMKNQIDLIPDIELININDNIKTVVEPVFLDFTLDIFNLTLNPPYLYNIFKDYLKQISYLRMKGIDFSIIKHYPFSSNISSLLMIQKIIDQFLELLIEFYNAHLIMVPHIISRYSLKRLYNPVIDIIQSLRMGRALRLRVSENSRYSFIYSHDLINSLFGLVEKANKHHIVIEGNELSLKDMYRIGEPIVGHTPIHFDRENFIHYHYPNISAYSVNQVEYEFPNILFDLISRLF